MEHDPLARALSAINNAEKASKEEVTIRPSSKLMIELFKLLKKEKYIEDLEIIEDGKGRIIKIKLNQNINKIGVIKPRYSVKLDEYEKFESRYLPAKDFGRIILTTSEGILTHIEARKKKIGGVLLAFVY